MRSTIAIAATCVLAVSLAVVPANAQDARERALDYFRLSAAEYEAGRFAEAAGLLRQALRLHDDPRLHYNLARALDAMGDASGAVASYETYLEMLPDAPNRSSAESRLGVLREQIARTERLERERDAAQARLRAEEEQAEARARERREQEEQTEETHEDEGEPQVSEVEGESSSSFDIAPWLVTAGGVGVAAAGLAFRLVGRSKHDDAVANSEHRMAVELADQADTFELLSYIFFIAGGVTAAAGLVWGLLTLGGDDESESMAVVIGPGSVTLHGTFH